MPSDSAVLCRTKKHSHLPPLPAINTNIASGSDDSNPGIMQDPSSRNDRINNWLLPVSPGFGVPASVTLGSPVTNGTPTAPVATPFPTATASHVASASTGNVMGLGPYPGHPYGRSSLPNTPFPRIAFPGVASPPPVGKSQVAQAKATDGMNRQKLFLEQYRSPGVQTHYQPPHCAPYPFTGRTAYAYQPIMPRTPPAVTPPQTPAPFKFDPKAPEFRPTGQVQSEKVKKTSNGPFVVGR